MGRCWARGAGRGLAACINPCKSRGMRYSATWPGSEAGDLPLAGSNTLHRVSICCCTRSKKPVISAGCLAAGKCDASESCIIVAQPSRLQHHSRESTLRDTRCGTYPQLLNLGERWTFGLLHAQARKRPPLFGQIHSSDISFKLLQCPAAQAAHAQDKGCSSACLLPVSMLVYLASACSVAGEGRVSILLIDARTAKGRSSPMCILTTHSCTFEACSRKHGAHWTSGPGPQDRAWCQPCATHHCHLLCLALVLTALSSPWS